jgi:glycine/D-amino acid oxidase-like deaminating enzyme
MASSCANSNRGSPTTCPAACSTPATASCCRCSPCGAMLRQAKRTTRTSQVRPVHRGGRHRTRGRPHRAACAPRPATIATAIVVNAAACGRPSSPRWLGQPRLPIYPRAGNLAITGHHVTPIRTQLLESQLPALRARGGQGRSDAHRRSRRPRRQHAAADPRRLPDRQHPPVPRHGPHAEHGAAAPFAAARAALCAGLAAAPIVRTWVGLRPYSIDKHPLIGPWPARARAVDRGGPRRPRHLAGADHRALLAQQIAGQPTTIDATPYLPARFDER